MTIQTIPAGAVLAQETATSVEPGLRALMVAGIAAAQAEAVDRDGRFPVEAMEAAKAQRLMGLIVPAEFGGEGASLAVAADVCYALGRACASTAMIYAMHLTKVACIVDHGRGQPWQEALLRRLCRDQLLLASSTTEGQGGGNLRSSAAAIERDGGFITLDRAATVISYGAEADGVVTTARRAPDAAASDQVLAVFLKEDYTLERLSGWETLGMRGTCSYGFRLRARGLPDQVLAVPYQTIHAETMTPVSHILWSSAWAGIAAGAVERAQAFTRQAARGAGGQMPPGAAHCGKAASSLRSLRGLITQALDRYAAAGEAKALGSLDFQTAITMLKVESSELALATVSSAMRACGLAGYRQDGPFSIGRALRDILSAPIMIHNDRISANLAATSLLSTVPASLRD
ncbi:acyl-CoA dehydrogenase family protein [Methylobacterium nodulans]|uniref:Acyl-CoA dehydrogenase domain protein n=1 Tax=Methylobacterium nodulans (strain LMG 21967 / CNCM I-2342 / ORS 2060) TaxID=460265 RepID=B8IBN5_METNO|nr:acyl-CoA dehydrogenase family protein [Methylobacterium nodulans]ACL59289.1 acyl-CoA dehydrogenase domain protein [Methylobacterium nodulans ORS 2060]